MERKVCRLLFNTCIEHGMNMICNCSRYRYWDRYGDFYEETPGRRFGDEFELCMEIVLFCNVEVLATVLGEGCR